MEENKTSKEPKITNITKFSYKGWIGDKHYYVDGTLFDKGEKTLLQLDCINCSGKFLTYKAMYKFYETNFNTLAEEVKKQTNKTIHNVFEKVVDTAGKI